MRRNCARVGKSSGPAPECLLRRDGRVLLLPDGFTEQGASAGAQVAADRIESVVQPTERVSRPDAQDRIPRRGVVRRPSRGIRFDPDEAIGDPTLLSTLIALGVKGDVDPDGGQVGSTLQQLEQPGPRAAAEVDHATRCRRVESREQPTRHVH